MKKSNMFKLAVAFVFVLSPCISHADPAPGDEMFIFHLGYFLPSFKTKLEVNNENGSRGTEFDAEDDLGLDSNKTVIRGDVTWRISDRNRLQLGYFNFSRTGHRVIDREITIGEETYPVGATLDSDFDFTIIPISYYFSVVKNTDWEVGLGVGLQWSTIKLDVNGSVSSGATADREARADASAPLPLLAADVKYYIFPVWSVGGNLGVFDYKVGASNMTMQGTVVSAAVNTDWWFSEYVGAGLALNWFAIDVDVDGSKWNGSFNYQYWGPQIYLGARF